jgi:7,8-dihydroneopterin aldolase/epimerase/oxygenase
LFVILSMEKIIIKDIRLVGFHGLYDYEKKDGVDLGFDIELFFHNQINNDSDNIDQTVNYVDVIDTVKRINSSNSFNLIETLCNNLINEIVELYKPLKTTVRIRKFKLPIDTPLSFIEVEMTKENDV